MHVKMPKREIPGKKEKEKFLEKVSSEPRGIGYYYKKNGRVLYSECRQRNFNLSRGANGPSSGMKSKEKAQADVRDTLTKK